jgi:hypothetical protein
MWIGYHEEFDTMLWLTFRPEFTKNSTTKFKLKPVVYSSETGKSVVARTALDLERLPTGLSRLGWLNTAQEAFEVHYKDWLADHREEKQRAKQKGTKVNKDFDIRDVSIEKESASFKPTMDSNKKGNHLSREGRSGFMAASSSSTHFQGEQPTLTDKRSTLENSKSIARLSTDQSFTEAETDNNLESPRKITMATKIERPGFLKQSDEAMVEEWFNFKRMRDSSHRRTD